MEGKKSLQQIFEELDPSVYKGDDLITNTVCRSISALVTALILEDVDREAQSAESVVDRVGLVPQLGLVSVPQECAASDESDGFKIKTVYLLPKDRVLAYLEEKAIKLAKFIQDRIPDHLYILQKDDINEERCRGSKRGLYIYEDNLLLPLPKDITEKQCYTPLLSKGVLKGKIADIARNIMQHQELLGLFESLCEEIEGIPHQEIFRQTVYNPAWRQTAHLYARTLLECCIDTADLTTNPQLAEFRAGFMNLLQAYSGRMQPKGE